MNMVGKNFKFKGKDFLVEKYLGKGKAGYSYLITFCDEKYVLKIIHDEPCVNYSFGDKMKHELNAYNKLKQLGVNIPRLHKFDLENKYLIKDYVSGKFVFEALEYESSADKIFKQMLNMTRLVYPENINLDYFPLNFIVQDDDELFYVDYEISPYSNRYNFENWGLYYWLNKKGMTEYIKTGDQAIISTTAESGMPIKEPFEVQVQNILKKYRDIVLAS